MKGLLYKDLTLLLRSYKNNLLLLVVLYGAFVLFTGETYMAYALTVLCSLYTSSTINFDEQSHWDAYARTLPVTPAQIVGSKYLLNVLFTVVGAAAAAVMIALIPLTGAAPGDPAECAAGITACACVSLLMSALLMPVSYRWGGARARSYMVAIIFAIIFLGILMGQLMSEAAKAALANSLAGFSSGSVWAFIVVMLAVTLVLYAVSYTICVGIYRKKEV